MGSSVLRTELVVPSSSRRNKVYVVALDGAYNLCSRHWDTQLTSGPRRTHFNVVMAVDGCAVGEGGTRKGRSVVECCRRKSLKRSGLWEDRIYRFLSTLAVTKGVCTV
jgi:hypothetical protein